MLATLLSFFVMGLVVLILATVALSIVGVVIGGTLSIAGFLLFKVAPVLLVGWAALKLLNRGKRQGELSAADRRWLENGD